MWFAVWHWQWKMWNSFFTYTHTSDSRPIGNESFSLNEFHNWIAAYHSRWYFDLIDYVAFSPVVVQVYKSERVGFGRVETEFRLSFDVVLFSYITTTTSIDVATAGIITFQILGALMITNFLPAPKCFFFFFFPLPRLMPSLDSCSSDREAPAKWHFYFSLSSSANQVPRMIFWQSNFLSDTNIKLSENIAFGDMMEKVFSSARCLRSLFLAVVQGHPMLARSVLRIGAMRKTLWQG